MRNKENFIKDVNEVIRTNVLDENQIIEDAAHTMNHSQLTEFSIPKDFTLTKKEEVFLFEKKEREATDDSNETVEDYFYIGRGE